MNPIINPWWFYLLERIDVIMILSVLGAIASGFMVVFSILDEREYGIFNEPNRLDKDYVKAKKNRKLFTKILIPFLIIAILTPSSNTVYKMIVAQNVTPNNIQAIGGTLEDAIDYIFEKIDALDDCK